MSQYSSESGTGRVGGAECSRELSLEQFAQVFRGQARVVVYAMQSGHDALDHFPRHAGQSYIQSLEFAVQPQVIDSHQSEHRRV